MNWTERLKKICEAAFPYPEKCCSSCKSEIEHVRYIRYIRYMKAINGMGAEEKEKQVREWEEKY